MITAVITTVRGRHDHLRTQLAGIARTDPGPDEHFVVAMGDREVTGLVARCSPAARVLEIDVDAPGDLPLATARNAGATAAIEAGAELLVFLDVDCIPGPALFDRYSRAAGDPQHRDAILCGPVSYLPPRPGHGGDLHTSDLYTYDLDPSDLYTYDLDHLPAADPHPARPAPPAGEILVAEDRRLFWSLSFAVTTATWHRIGGFHPGYVGYGGEDTDFSEQAHAADVGMRWVGGAEAFHQHHPISSPPIEHLEAIVRNARLFHQRWGWWPMTGWLDAFAERGLVGYDANRGWQVTAPAEPRS